ncbi:MAG: CRISPR-associated endonuclease Cas2 [Candidatus Cloacimonetes bacterium]|nr:CRISPR-associated endonuclease Cas2 [Candidatus Cloacimonadota bacterium]
MYVIAMYDIGEKRVGKILKIFRKYLTWIQKSVFEGEITKAKLEKLKLELLEKIDADYDSIVFFELRADYVMKKNFVGKVFDPFDNLL